MKQEEAMMIVRTNLDPNGDAYVMRVIEAINTISDYIGWMEVTVSECYEYCLEGECKQEKTHCLSFTDPKF